MLDEALTVQWIGVHFFFSFELSYLRVPEKPRLGGARSLPIGWHKTSCRPHFHCAEWCFAVLSDSPPTASNGQTLAG